MTNHQAIGCLTFVGGFIDAAGYVMLYGLFTASITGNIVAACIPIYFAAVGVWPRFIVWLSIGMGAWMITMLSMKLRFATSLNKWKIGVILFSCEIAALFLAMFVGAALDYPMIDSWQVFISATLVSFSMGVQNGAAMVMIANCPPTTAMTGNTVRLFIYGAEAFNFYLASKSYITLYSEKGGKPADYEKTMMKYSQELASKFQLFCAALGPFVAGSIIGVPLAYNIGFWSFVVPILVVAGVVINIHIAGKTAGYEMLKSGKGIVELGDAIESPMAAAALEQQLQQQQAQTEDDNIDTFTGKPKIPYAYALVIDENSM